MSKSMNRAASNISRFSSQTPRGVDFGHKTKKSETSPKFLDAQGFLVKPSKVERVEVEDEYSAMATRISSETEARRVLRNHPLVVEYGFLVGDLIGQDPTQIEIMIQACESAKILGRIESCKILKIEDRGQSLFAIGVQVGLVKMVLASDAFKARINEIEIENKKAQEKRKMTSSIPRRQSAAPTPHEILAAPTEKPAESNHLGQIELAPGVWGYICACGCGQPMTPEYAFVPGFDDMWDRQNSHVSVADLWRHAFTKACVYRLYGRYERKTFHLLATRGQIEKAEAETARRQTAYRAEEARLEQVRREEEARRLAKSRASSGQTRVTGKTAANKNKRPGQSWQDAAVRGPRSVNEMGELGSLFSHLAKKVA